MQRAGPSFTAFAEEVAKPTDCSAEQVKVPWQPPLGEPEFAPPRPATQADIGKAAA